MRSEYPVGTIVASATEVYIKKQRQDGYKSFEEYWIGASGHAWPFYGDTQVNKWISDGTHKIVRLGTDG